MKRLSWVMPVLCVLATFQGVRAARQVDPLALTGGAVFYSQSTGRTTVVATMIVPRADALDGANVGVAIGGGTALFILNGKGQAKTAEGTVSLKLGKPTCGCPDGSHSAILTVSVKGTKKAPSPFMSQNGAVPTTATIYFSSGAEAVSYNAQFTPRR